MCISHAKHLYPLLLIELAYILGRVQYDKSMSNYVGKLLGFSFIIRVYRKRLIVYHKRDEVPLVGTNADPSVVVGRSKLLSKNKKGKTSSMGTRRPKFGVHTSLGVRPTVLRG